MRKIILNIAVSLDGYIEGPNGEYDWCFTDQDYGMTAFYEQTDALFIGRKSYALISDDASAFADKEVYVFSDTLTGEYPPNVEIISKGNYKGRIEDIRHQPGKNIWLFGGADLISGFINNNFINEVVVSVHPVILGGGKALFQHITGKIELELIKHEVFSSGLIQLTYTQKPRFDYSLLAGIKI